MDGVDYFRQGDSMSGRGGMQTGDLISMKWLNGLKNSHFAIQFMLNITHWQLNMLL
ncbi:hypothetical protein D3C84_989700 [compost metagenome]